MSEVRVRASLGGSGMRIIHSIKNDMFVELIINLIKRDVNYKLKINSLKNPRIFGIHKL